MEIKTIIIDVNAYTSFRRGTEEAVDVIRSVPIIIISPIVTGELLSGFAMGSGEMRNRKELELFLSSPRVRFVNINKKTAEYYSVIYRKLRKKGRPIPTNDLWIAATALQYGLAVFTYDEHFKSIDELVIVSKVEDLTRGLK